MKRFKTRFLYVTFGRMCVFNLLRVVLFCPQVRKFGAWRRRSEPCRETSLVVSQSQAEPTSTTNAGNNNVKMRDEQPREVSGTFQVEIAGASSSSSKAAAAIVDPEPPLLLLSQPTPQQQQQPQRLVPESLERIVEQLVLQNVEIQRILQRKKRRAAERQPSASSSSSSSRPYVRSESTTLDEGIYDTLLSPSANGSMMEAVGGVLSDIDGDYVTIRAEGGAGGGGAGGGHFSRCHLRRSLGNKTPESMVDSSQLAGLSNALSCHQQLQKATLSRSLSCPARGQQAVRVAKKSEASIAESGAASLAAVGGRIQKLLNHIGSPDHWSNWIRSLSPPQRRNSTDQRSVEPDASSTSRSRSRREPIDLDVDPMNISTSPCVPSVWLQMQSEHLAEPGKKSGSLPRSFQVFFLIFMMIINHFNILFLFIENRLHWMSSHVGWIDQSPSLPIVRLLLIFKRTL
jgi:hypothetical protein